MLRPSDDIDARDAENPLLVTDYVNEMYHLFNEQEVLLAINHKYMSSQPYVNEKMRCILIDWMVRDATKDYTKSKKKQMTSLSLVYMHVFLKKSLSLYKIIIG